MVRRRLTSGPGTALAALIAVTALIAGCGGGASSEELREAREEGAMQARQQEKLKQLESAVKALKKSGKGATVVIGSSASPSGDGDTVRLENCGNDVYARSDTTSCEFARNVQANYYSEIGSGSGVVNSYSPKTGTHYDMDCTAGRPHVCTGGDEAEVYFP